VKRKCTAYIYIYIYIYRERERERERERLIENEANQTPFEKAGGKKLRWGGRCEGQCDDNGG
jgi:hypothetical protein